MNPADTSAVVTEAVHTALREALELDDAQLVDNARIMVDLGAESIDLLDIRFRLERALGIQISAEHFVRAFSETNSTEEFQQAFTVAAMCAVLIAWLESDNE